MIDIAKLASIAVIYIISEETALYETDLVYRSVFNL